MITIKNLTKSFKLEKEYFKAIDNINIEISKGEIYGIIGYSGAGKTTLLKSIATLEKVDKGSVIIDGVDVFSLTRKSKREFKKEIGIVFQGFSLLRQSTVFKNVSLPLEIDKVKKNDIKKEVFKVLETVGLENKASAYPSQLSGGQIQRVAIARAIISKPKCLLLDEITSALDPVTTIQILKLLKKINQEYKITILLITHDMKVVQSICTKVALLDQGKIVEEGRVEAIIKNPKSSVGKIFFKECL